MAKGRGYMGGPHSGKPIRQKDMMRQVQKMQEDMVRMQEELENKTFEATSGGGMVRAVVNGNKELSALVIDPEAVDPEDVEMLQDLVVAAVNEALRAAETASSENMSKLTGGLDLGALGGLGGFGL